MERLREKEKAGEVFVIRPSQKLNIKRMEKNPEKMQAAYELGMRDAGSALDGLREYLCGSPAAEKIKTDY